MALFSVVFLALTLSGWLALRFTSLEDRGRGATRLPPPPASEYFLAGFHGTLEHRIFLHGERGTLDYLRTARVLILGTSRVLFGLRQTELRPGFRSLGWSYFVLGFIHGEQDAFPEEIIQKFDLRPQIVICDVPGFFTGKMTPEGEEVLSKGRFEAQKSLFELEAHYWTARVVHRVFPHLVNAFLEKREHATFRSRMDGTFLFVPEPDSSGPFVVEPPGEDPITAAVIAEARRFQLMLARRGSRLVLTHLPRPGWSRHSVWRLARELGVPLIAPTHQGLTSAGDNHLDLPSARRFGRGFMNGFEREVGPSPERP